MMRKIALSVFDLWMMTLFGPEELFIRRVQCLVYSLFIEK